jgi:hypothetical protein
VNVLLNSRNKKKCHDFLGDD